LQISWSALNRNELIDTSFTRQFPKLIDQSTKSANLAVNEQEQAIFRVVDHAWTNKGEAPIMPIFTKCHSQPTPLLWVAVSES